MPNDISRNELLKVKGTIFIKYGRYGKPHKRTVYLNSDESKLLWKDSEKPLEKPRSFKTSEILNVMIGSDHTKVFKKHKIPLEYDNYCISIRTAKRTLDLRYDDQKIIQVWFEKIKNIITSNSESRIAKQTQDGQLKSLKRNEIREIIDEIWKNEILLNWQNYWDPLNRKLRIKKVTINYDEKE